LRRALLIALAGCSEFGFDPIDPDEEPPEVVVVDEAFVQAPLEAVDVLFVLDETRSMEQEYAVLGPSAEGMMSTLDDLGIRWQLGVVGADMTSDRAGVLRGRPWVITPSTPDRAALFEDLVRVSLLPTTESGLAAAVTALDEAEPGGRNAGFRRPEASLQVVFVSDDDDASDAWLDDPVAATLDVLDHEGEAADAVASALVGDVPGGCSSGRGTAQPGERYVEVAEATGGTVASICEADFSEVLVDVAKRSVVLPRRFVLAEDPEGDEVNVTVDDEPSDAFVVERPEDGAAEAAVVFDVAPPAGSRITVSYPVANR